jgi:hypothetical protein
MNKYKILKIKSKSYKKIKYLQKSITYEINDLTNFALI